MTYKPTAKKIIFDQLRGRMTEALSEWSKDNPKAEVTDEILGDFMRQAEATIPQTKEACRTLFETIIKSYAKRKKAKS